MGIKKGEDYWYGEEQADIRPELHRYSHRSRCPVEHIADAVCTCGSRVFRLYLDHGVGIAVRICTACGEDHLIGNNHYNRYFAELEKCECPCGQEVFEMSGRRGLDGGKRLRPMGLPRLPMYGLRTPRLPRRVA